MVVCDSAMRWAVARSGIRPPYICMDRPWLMLLDVDASTWLAVKSGAACAGTAVTSTAAAASRPAPRRRARVRMEFPLVMSLPRRPPARGYRGDRAACPPLGDSSEVALIPDFA